MKRTLITFFVTLAALFAATPYAVAYDCDCEVDDIKLDVPTSSN